MFLFRACFMLVTHALKTQHLQNCFGASFLSFLLCFCIIFCGLRVATAEIE